MGKAGPRAGLHRPIQYSAQQYYCTSDGVKRHFPTWEGIVTCHKRELSLLLTGTQASLTSPSPLDPMKDGRTI